MYCDTSLPKGHVKIEAFDFHDFDITVSTTTEEVCEEYLPYPDPPGPGSKKCFLNKYNLNRDWYVSMDLQVYNSRDVDFWHVDPIEVKNQTGYVQAELFYQPCQAMQCPVGTYCEGREDATIWLCFNSGSGIGTRTCRSFGDFDNEIDFNVENYQDYSFSSGLEVDYYTQGRRGKVYINCDATKGPGILGLPSFVTFSQNNMMYFNVTAEDACSVGPPRWHPPTPVKPDSPTPTPQPSPNAIDFACNETHYIYTDLDGLYQSVFNGTVKLSYPGARLSTLSRWDVWYHPWDQIPCPIYPEAADCFGFNEANIWGCWHDDNGKYVCFPIGDVDYGNDARPRGALDNGIEMIYEGAWGYHTEINVKCVPGEEDTEITFDQVTTSSWMNTNGITVLFETDSEYVCPIPFNTSDRIPRSPSPTPVPSKYKGPLSFQSTMINNTYAQLDLSLLDPVVDQQVYVGYRGDLYRMKIHYSPVEKVDCPKTGFECLGGAKSNIWYCGDYSQPPDKTIRKLCVPGGDIDAGLVVDNFDDNNPMSGIIINYDGGYGNLTETHIIFQCNGSVPAHKVIFEPVIDRRFRSAASTYIARAHTSDVCPIALMRQSVTGGAVFLLIVILGVIGYFSILTLVFFVLKGQAAIPNEQFWYDFGYSIFGLFHCGGDKFNRMSDI